LAWCGRDRLIRAAKKGTDRRQYHRSGDDHGVGCDVSGYAGNEDGKRPVARRLIRHPRHSIWGWKKLRANRSAKCGQQVNRLQAVRRATVISAIQPNRSQHVPLMRAERRGTFQRTEAVSLNAGKDLILHAMGDDQCD